MMSCSSSSLLIILLSAAVSMSGCDWIESYHHLKQSRTVADLGLLVKQVQAIDPAERTPARIEAILQKSDRNVDAWGHPFLYSTKSSQGGMSYLLVAVGSDGELDIDDINDYFELEEGENIRGEANEDIVFRDGRSLFIVGK